MIEKINEIKSQFFGKMNKTGKNFSKTGRERGGKGEDSNNQYQE